MNFNSHAHVERDLFHKKSSKTISHFNSHAHVERDLIDEIAGSKNVISTHTLTWSVTWSTVTQRKAARAISTHTLTWSVT